MVPRNLQGKPWTTDAASMVLNRIKRDVADELLLRDAAKGVPLNGVVTKMIDAAGQVTEDRERCVEIKIDAALSAIRHDGRTCRILTRKCWALYLRRQRDDSSLTQAAAYSLEDPLGETLQHGFKLAERVHWDDDDLAELHKLGMYLDRKPKSARKTEVA